MSRRAPVPTADGLIAQILAHSAELRAMGVKSLAIFGSAARNEAAAKSDVDLLADFETLSLFQRIRISNFLAELLQQEVDLVPRDSIRPQLKDAIESSAVRIF